MKSPDRPGSYRGKGRIANVSHGPELARFVRAGLVLVPLGREARRTLNFEDRALATDSKLMTKENSLTTRVIQLQVAGHAPQRGSHLLPRGVGLPAGVSCRRRCAGSQRPRREIPEASALEPRTRRRVPGEAARTSDERRVRKLTYLQT